MCRYDVILLYCQFFRRSYPSRGTCLIQAPSSTEFFQKVPTSRPGRRSVMSLSNVRHICEIRIILILLDVFTILKKRSKLLVFLSILVLVFKYVSTRLFKPQ